MHPTGSNKAPCTLSGFCHERAKGHLGSFDPDTRCLHLQQALLADSGDAGASLMRQIQSLAAQTAAAQSNAAEQEALLLGRLRAAEQAAAAAADAEQEAVARATSAEAAVQAAREAAAAAVQVWLQCYGRLFL